ncbi:hypothetical protein VNO80_12153 [Phaseolus coccineus]|uniref:Uncharacterized protein n=1 Tax=Phaseolus coccineus TaxID=3886 RepID=A0AAN9RL42_PHACN
MVEAKRDKEEEEEEEERESKFFCVSFPVPPPSSPLIFSLGLGSACDPLFSQETAPVQFNHLDRLARKLARPVACDCFGFDCLGSGAVCKKVGSLNSFLDTEDHTWSREIHAWSKNKMERFPLL